MRQERRVPGFPVFVWVPVQNRSSLACLLCPAASSDIMEKNREPLVCLRIAGSYTVGRGPTSKVPRDGRDLQTTLTVGRSHRRSGPCWSVRISRNFQVNRGGEFVATLVYICTQNKSTGIREINICVALQSSPKDSGTPLQLSLTAY